MQRLLALWFLLFAICSPAYSQVPLPGFERLKQIRLLESSPFDVKQILWDFEAEEPDRDDHTQGFSTKEMSVEVRYSSGACTDDEDDEEGQLWDIPEWKATAVEIEPEEPIKLEDLQIDLSKFKKEQMYVDLPKVFIYHAKNIGIAFRVDDYEVDKIYLFPRNGTKAKLCKTSSAEKFTSKSWFGNSKLEDRHGVIACYTADITNLALSTAEFTVTDPDREINVETTAIDPENDVLTYNYTVTGGKIVGQGPKVLWSLKGLLPGTYSITAAVDDGCGFCGKTITKTVLIK